MTGKISTPSKIASCCTDIIRSRGSFLLSRLTNYYPSLFTKLIFIDVGYSAPGSGLTLAGVDHINATVQAKLGYSILGYFKFFQDDDATFLLDNNVCKLP